MANLLWTALESSLAAPSPQVLNPKGLWIFYISPCGSKICVCAPELGHTLTEERGKNVEVVMRKRMPRSQPTGRTGHVARALQSFFSSPSLSVIMNPGPSHSLLLYSTQTHRHVQLKISDMSQNSDI